MIQKFENDRLEVCTKGKKPSNKKLDALQISFLHNTEKDKSKQKTLLVELRYYSKDIYLVYSIAKALLCFT